jgi:uncharacterized membrane protein YdjX (TVP38/TMEM64 family)
MSQPPTVSTEPSAAANRRRAAVRIQRILKSIIVIVLLALLAASVWLLFTTQTGQQLRENPVQLAATARQVVHHHPISAPLLYIALYVLLATLGFLPVWWLQILAGAGFGLWFGTLWSLLGATISAGLTVGISRWIAADWFHQRVESRMVKLRKLDSQLGHNGFLVVMTVRLIHLLPFGLCNYALGLTTVSMMDVILGTFLGSIPAISIYIGMGAGYHPWRNWRFDAAVAAINVLLLLPLILRYLRPQWFKQWGVE